MKKVSRRSFLTLAATAAAGAAAPASASTPQQQPMQSMPMPMEEAPPLPHEAADKNFVPDLTLTTKWIIKEIEGKKVKLRSYNEQIPGPLIKCKAGRTLNIRVENQLTPYDSSQWGGDMNVPHMLDHTNLHLHGLDIAPHLFEPLGTCDVAAAMISIAPGEYKDYPFVIPDDQSPGLNWYHPHAHGSTAVQAVSGMAGGLIIEGAIDEVPEIKAAADHVLVLQDLGLFQTDEPNADYTESYEPKQNAIWQTFASDPSQSVTIMGKPTVPPLSCGFTTGDYHLRYYLVNGEPYFKEEHSFTSPTSPTGTQLSTPTFKMQPGEVARFRILNGCSDLMMPIQVDQHDMHLIAMDGNNFDEPYYRPYVPNAHQVIMGPANRAEFLIKAIKTPGKYNILQLQQSAQFLAADQKVIAVIEIAGDEKDMDIPKSLPPITRDPPITDKDIVRERKFVFSGLFPGVQNPVVGIDFRINNQLYDEFAVPTTVFLNTCEEWTIEVPDAARGGTEGHPFHIHVNDFEVVSVAGIKPPHRMIMDTLWVAQETASVIRLRFKQWIGKSVFHCHILPHEDTGMMQNFLILPEKPKHHHEYTIESLEKKSS